MKLLYAPWRDDTSRGHSGAEERAATYESIFSKLLRSEDAEAAWLIKRFEHTAILMNSYPYNAGHLLVVPYREVALLEELTDSEQADLMKALTYATSLVQRALACPGVNVGINMGDRCAGGSIPEHLHLHVIPRWPGDTGFLATTAGTKPISYSLREIYLKLKHACE